MAQRVTIQSFDWRGLQAMQRLAPQVPTACLTLRNASTDNAASPAWTAGLSLADHAGDVAALVQAAGCRIWSPNAGMLTEALVRAAQSRGLQVLPWTVNDPQQMGRLMDWGVNGLITDYPDRLRAVMAARGLPLPAPVTPRARSTP